MSKITNEIYPPLSSGTFTIGCNYWASHAGTAMWKDWRPEIVEHDLSILAENKIKMIRIFPLWSDFQPITALYGGLGKKVEIRFGEKSLPHTYDGDAGIDSEMLGRFEHFCKIAEKYNIKLIVGLLTGWMSGRLFVPKALEGLNVITDPFCLMWEVRFVKRFIEKMRSQNAIFAWDLGNECNCMAPATRDEAYVWSATIGNTIRAADSSRPLISGMHSLGTESNSWLISDQAEHCDLLTTHPYPYWVNHCRKDPINSIRITLHATAETSLYRDIGKKPCFAEEIGTMGPMLASDTISAAFCRTNLFSLWAHDCLGFMWWCASDQTNLNHAPYDWTAVELELGLFRNDGTPKPVLKEMKAFANFIEELPFQRLPLRSSDAVCILTRGQDQWGVAYATFVLATQAGLTLRFCYTDQIIPQAEIYLIPSVESSAPMNKSTWNELLLRCEAGATLYFSVGNGIFYDFNRVAGVELQTRIPRMMASSLHLSNEKTTLTITGGDILSLTQQSAEVLGEDTDGNPIFLRNKLGKGEVFFLGFPMEMELTKNAGVFHKEHAEPYYKIYKEISNKLCNRIVTINNPNLGITRHPLSSDCCIIIVINYSELSVNSSLRLEDGWEIGEVFYNKKLLERDKIELENNDAVVFKVIRT